MSLSSAESAVFAVFRTYLARPGEMVCFPGPLAQQYAATLLKLTQRDLLVKESFAPGYSLTAAGYDAMCADAR